MKLIVYSLPYKVTNEADKINHLFNEGLKEFHLRKPTFKKQEIEELILNIDSKYWSKIIIHSNYNLAKKYNLKGIHVPNNFFDGVVGIFRKMQYQSIKAIYTSVFSCNKIKAIKFPFKKVFLGPLYKHFSATQTVPNFNIFELKEVLHQSNYPIVAMGGVNINNYNELSNLKFEGVVLQSAIWKSDDYINAFNAFMLKNGKTNFDTNKNKMIIS